MHFNKWLLGSACVLAIVATVAVSWLHAATPTVGPAAASPAYIVVNTPTPITFTVKVTDPTLLPNGINLLKTDASGKTLSTIGIMHDDGVNGDAKAADEVFSYALTVNQPAVGQVYYRASVAFKGVLQRVLSSVTLVTVDPFKLPPDPGEAGQQTLAGVDSDHDGIRDDVQRYIAIVYSDLPKVRLGTTQYAGSVMHFLDQSHSKDGAEQWASQSDKAFYCLAYVMGLNGAIRATDDVRGAILNTKSRSLAYVHADAQLSGTTFDLLPEIANKSQCEFDPDR